MKLRCDICDNLTGNPLIIKGNDGLPLIVCQMCYAKKKRPAMYHKLTRQKQYIAKPKIYTKDNRKVILSLITRTNSKAFYIEKFIDDVKIGYELEYSKQTATKQIKRFLEDRKDQKIPKWTRHKLTTNFEYSGNMNKSSKTYKKKLRYVTSYNREHYKHFAFALSRKKDAELIEFLDTSKNKADLLRDMYECYKLNKKDGII